ncbi:MAG: hypothetical protein QOC93_1698 [Actinomycetota bacterium]|nr:hypothetical protein [Actinomycetota bacterium]
MPPDHYYGVVAGTFASFSREDPRDDGHWYHGRVRVDTPPGGTRPRSTSTPRAGWASGTGS